jgi:hypothetical protein
VHQAAPPTQVNAFPTLQSVALFDESWRAIKLAKRLQIRSVLMGFWCRFVVLQEGFRSFRKNTLKMLAI